MLRVHDPSSNNGTALLHYRQISGAFEGPRQLHPELSAKIVLQRHNGERLVQPEEANRIDPVGRNQQWV